LSDRAERDLHRLDRPKAKYVILAIDPPQLTHAAICGNRTNRTNTAFGRRAAGTERSRSERVQVAVLRVCPRWHVYDRCRFIWGREWDKVTHGFEPIPGVLDLSNLALVRSPPSPAKLARRPFDPKVAQFESVPAHPCTTGPLGTRRYGAG